MTVSPETPFAVPASALSRRKRRRAGMDPLTAIGAVFFLIAVAAAAYPAIRAGPTTGPGLLLLIGLGGVALLGLLMFGAGEQERTETEGEDDQRVVDALSEPAAVARPDGRIVAANANWRATGALARLPGGANRSAGLYTALSGARQTGAGETTLKLGGADRRAAISRLGDTRLLVRLPPVQVRDDPRLAPPEAEFAAAETDVVAPEALNAFAAAAPFGAALLDGADLFETRIVEANETLDQLTAGRATPGAAFGDLLAPEGLADVRERLGHRRSGPVEVRLAGPGARVAQLYVTGAGGRLVVYLLDLTERKELEMQLAQSQKMQAIGQLAGGVAHDFNNLLTAIQLHLDELLQRHPVGDPSYEGLKEIKQTGARAADLVRKLLAFSRKQTVQRETLELGELISESEVLLRRVLREDVRLVTEYGRDLPSVRADRSQLETAVMNLAVNARDALRSHPPVDGALPMVRIRTARVDAQEALRLGHKDGPAGAYALIEVADNGAGIPDAAMTKIFEPFFTTKPVGEGTGLGLATTYGIVKQADGFIYVENGDGRGEMGRGAIFRVFLPIHVPSEEEEAAPRAPLKFKPPARDLSGAGRILFVEDEASVRIVAARLLRARGYEVLEAGDAEEALEIAEAHAGEIDLLISDVVMPGADGPTLLKKARPFLQGAQVMFISGYAEAEFSDLLEGEEGVTFLAKPVEIKVLAERVKQQLQSG